MATLARARCTPCGVLLRLAFRAATHENVLGVLSLIIYSLLLVISVKYIAIVMRADNEGEGGILALTALLPSAPGTGRAGPFGTDGHLRCRPSLR